MDDHDLKTSSSTQGSIPDNRPIASGIHLTFRNRHGSVQHYYHFLFACIVPLVRIWNSITISLSGRDVSVRSCAIMDELLYQLRLPRLVIMDPAAHTAIYDRRAESANIERPLFITLEGYDDPVRYNAEVFTSVRDQLLFRFIDEIQSETQEINRLFTGTGPRVVIIRRLSAAKFYSEAECEIKTAGSERRSVANMDEVCSVALRYSENVLVAALEGRSLYYQMALFAAADIVIGQHGAALGNLLWARNGIKLIEIIPKELKDRVRECDYFGDLARCLSVRHYRLWQELPHGPVDTGMLANILRMITANSPASRSSLEVLSGLPKDSSISRSRTAKRSLWVTWRKLRHLATRAWRKLRHLAARASSLLMP